MTKFWGQLESPHPDKGNKVVEGREDEMVDSFKEFTCPHYQEGIDNRMYEEFRINLAVQTGKMHCNHLGLSQTNSKVPRWITQCVNT